MRFIAHVRTPGGHTDHVDCDNATVDARGYLWLNALYGDENLPFPSRTEQQAHSCYSPGAWISYRLQGRPGDDETDAGAPEPDQPLTVNVTVQGTVMSEAELLDTIARQMRRLGMRESQTWQPYQRH
jgi:hypothetical protein